MDWDDKLQAYTYQCPCGDVFQITKPELANGEEIAHCPSCSLIVRVIYDQDDFTVKDEDLGKGSLPTLRL